LLPHFYNRDALLSLQPKNVFPTRFFPQRKVFFGELQKENGPAVSRRAIDIDSTLTEDDS
jgi:hypothetical protein